MAEPTVPEPHRPRLPWWRQVLPGVLALGLVAAVCARVDWHAFATHLSGAHQLSFALFNLLFVPALLSADTLATCHVYRSAAPRVDYRGLWLLRGASYLPSLLNHHLGQAWLTWAMARRYRVDLGRMTGATLLVYVSWGGCVLLLAAGSVLAAGLPLGWLAVPLGAGLGYLGLLALRPARLARVRLLAPLFEAGVRGHLGAMVVRLPHLAVLFLGTWLPFWFFDVRVPLGAAITYVPLLMVAVTLPLTPQGLGTRDALAYALFARYAGGATDAERAAAVVAATASTAVMLLVIEAVLGLALVRRVTRLLRDGGAT